MRVVIIEVQTNKLTKQRIEVAPWEGILIEEVHGAANVSIVGTEFVDRDYPDPAEEFDRLTKRFGRPQDSEEAYTELVFGHGGRGVDFLAGLISQAEAKERKDLEEGPTVDLQANAVLKQIEKLSPESLALIANALQQRSGGAAIEKGAAPAERSPDLGRFGDGEGEDLDELEELDGGPKVVNARPKPKKGGKGGKASTSSHRRTATA